LKDRDWAYRRSGLFGRNDHQGGGIPVSLALMQLQSVLRENVARATQSKNLQVVIGECKSDGGEITADDVTKLGAVDDALSGVGCETFILFAKTSSFTSEEIERCKAARAPNGHRVIIWAKILVPFTLSLDRRKLLRRGPVHNSGKRQSRPPMHFDILSPTLRSGCPAGRL
jgi:hypothetical protein